jgi:nitroreductase
MLAARGLGLGTVITTLHKRREEQVKALLGISDNFETVCLIPLGYPHDEVHFGGGRRRPVEEVVFWERWGGPWPE